MNAAPNLARFFSLANVLSLSRVPLAGAFWLALHRQSGFPWGPLTVLGLAGITDILDGQFARLARPPPTSVSLPGRGAWLDPVCDKIFVGLVLVALFVERSTAISLVMMIFTRELIQIPTALGYRFIPFFRQSIHYNFTATIMGKITTVLQFAAIISLLFNTPATFYLAFVSGLSGLLAVGDYLRRAARIARHTAQLDPAET